MWRETCDCVLSQPIPLAQPGPALLDVVTSRMELVMPPFIGAQQAFGTALYSAKAILGGRAGDVWDLVTENL